MKKTTKKPATKRAPAGPQAASLSINNSQIDGGVSIDFETPDGSKMTIGAAHKDYWRDRAIKAEAMLLQATQGAEALCAMVVAHGHARRVDK